MSQAEPQMVNSGVSVSVKTGVSSGYTHIFTITKWFEKAEGVYIRRALRYFPRCDDNEYLSQGDSPELPHLKSI